MLYIFLLLLLTVDIEGQMCLPEPGDKVINMCENSFGNGNSLYLDTSRAVSYQGSCTCQLNTQGGAVDLQLSARGNQTDCDSTLFLSSPIEYAFRCVGTDPVVATGKIQPTQIVYITLTKSSSNAKAAMCVHIAQTSFAGSLSLLCYAGTLKFHTTAPSPVTTPTPLPTTPPAQPVPTTTVAQPVSSANSANICSADTRDTVINMCERGFGSGNSIYLDTTKSVNYQGDCVCQLSAQGGTVDLELSVKGVHADCNASLNIAPFIDYTFNCVQSESVSATGKVEVGQTVFVTLSKASPDAVADLCVHIMQTSFRAGSLSVVCNAGTPKPTTISGVPAATTVPVTNSTGSQVPTSTTNITTPARSGQTNTNETTATNVTVKIPQVIEPVCQTSSGDKVVNICERSFGSGTAIYLDTSKAVNYQGRCVCQLRAQGGTVDLQLTVQGGSSQCDATLYFTQAIDHTYNCGDRTPSNTTGRIEPRQMIILTLTKGSDAVADFCVLLVQTSFGAGSLSLSCTEGTRKPPITPRVPATTSTLVRSTTAVPVTKSTGNEVTTSTTNITTPAGSGQASTTTKMVTAQKPQVLEPACQTTTGDTVVNICERSFGSGTAIYLDTSKAVNYQGRCVCQLRAQGGTVDLQLTVQGGSSQCDATLYFTQAIDHTYNCGDRTPSNTTGRIEPGQMIILTLTKGSDAVADFCVLLVQTSFGGSLSLSCSEGTPKPKTTAVPPTTSTFSQNSTDSTVTERGSTGNTTSDPEPNTTTSSSEPKPTSAPSERTTGSGSTKAPTPAHLHQAPAHSTIVVSIVVVAVFGVVVVLMIIMVTVKHFRKKRSSKVAAAPSTANGLINVNL
ncbi:uncharacterized protein [Haliotis asinina]|uniref:uncharacterized protein n=1 Tax=Haliotis asinina TaxID=109174 RepID=UPI0035325F97